MRRLPNLCLVLLPLLAGVAEIPSAGYSDLALVRYVNNTATLAPGSFGLMTGAVTIQNLGASASASSFSSPWSSPLRRTSSAASR
jgi:hypothetical protein